MSDKLRYQVTYITTKGFKIVSDVVAIDPQKAAGIVARREACYKLVSVSHEGQEVLNIDNSEE